ncbi:MAG TPA: alcohol dehydrogenase family protein [Candidatus Saccharimonadales bacterium]|nr:alcohol dehydrogenase family protein [Candidatus Saccharimonadales bacterium]
MKALTFGGRETVRCETVPDAKIQEAGDAIVRVEMAAVCGSDLHVYHEREKGLDHGTTMGHECVGEVVAAGGEVPSFRIGDRVACPFTTSCGACFYCRRQLTSRCERGRLFGWVQEGTGLQGMQAEYVRVPLAESTLLALPGDIAPEEGLLLGDVLSTGFFCADLAGVGPGTTCAVVGCGPVGLMAIVAARYLGAGEVFCIDSIPERLRLGTEFGGTPIDFAEADPVEVIRQRTGGRGVDAVLEVVGHSSAMRSAVDLVRPGGVVASVGVHTDPHFSFSPAEAYDRNLTFRTGRCPARAYMKRLLPLVQGKKYALSSLITHRLPLSDGVRAYRIFDEKSDGCMKVVLSP